MYKFVEGELSVLLVHPGGPFWAKKDLGAWSIPKGEFDDEDPLVAAKREFLEELGVAVEGKFLALSPSRQKGGKIVHAWAVEGDVDPGDVRSNTFELEWPTKSGRKQSFPEVDRAEWFSIASAAEKINPGQAALLLELQQKLG